MDFKQSTDLAEQVPFRKENELPELKDLKPSETLSKQEIPDWLKEYLPDVEFENLELEHSDKLPSLDELKPESKLETPNFLEKFNENEKLNESEFENVYFVCGFSRQKKPELSGLTSLFDKTKEILFSKGYSDKIIENIVTEEEAEIYQNANVEPAVINGKEALVKKDIDLEIKDDRGRTNLERMKDGLAPLYYDGERYRPYELHHIGQGKDSPLIELTNNEHRGNGNDSILHDKKKESEIDREGEFRKERAEHWKARAEQLSN